MNIAPMPSAITDEMIEAAAEAIRNEFGKRSTYTTGYCRPLPWRALPAKLRNDYRAEAIAALHAALTIQ
jgi:hypothetical protein